MPDLSDVVDELFARQPETDMVPTLARVQRVMDLLGDPQRSPRIIHITGTNGKTSTARMIETLVIASGLRVGTYTSPHLHSVTERIRIDGAPIPEERFIEVYEDVRPIIDMVDGEQERDGNPPLTFFEVLTCLAFAAFADAPVDVAVIEVGLGGMWDGTNVADADVAVITPIAVDHERWLGDTPERIAVEKAGIIKTGSVVVSADQTPGVLDVLLRRCAEVGATAQVWGRDFDLLDRTVAVGGQVFAVQVGVVRYDEVFLPLQGAHQAANAVLAVAAVAALLVSDEPLDQALVDALGSAVSPGRLEAVTREPTVLLDAAHNHAGADVLALALGDSFTFLDTTAVVAVMADKDVAGILAPLRGVVDRVVATQNSSPRCLPAAELGRLAAGVWGEEAVEVEPDLAAAVAVARRHAEQSGGGVVVTGSVVTVADARAILTSAEVS
ncbi:MAG: folylpolyglutamate synthase/dihydrofolate synthase family protein [Candidatus Nanopelagicales bacterium]